VSRLDALSPLSLQFERLAQSVAERVADLLRAPVVVVDDRGATVASSQAGLSRLFAEQIGAEGQPVVLRVPMRLSERSGEVIVGEPAGEEAVSPRLAKALVEMIINEAAVLDRLPNQHEVKNKFIYDLLHSRIDDEEQILSQARFLGMDLAPPRAVILIDAAAHLLPPADPARGLGNDGDTRIQRQAQFIIGSVVSFFHLPSDTICAYIGDGEVAVLKASNTKNLAGWAEGKRLEDFNNSWANLAALKRAGDALLARLRSDTGASISIGIGRYHPGLRGLAYSYQDARVALQLGSRSHGRNRVHCIDELGVAGFVGVADEKTKTELAARLLSPLDTAPELLSTLEHFFAANCSPSSAAASLAIHRNTLTYRLDKITLLIGLDPRRFDDAVQIRLALLLRSLASDAPQP
jgi:carbohydrate diacid regulator